MVEALASQRVFIAGEAIPIGPRAMAALIDLLVRHKVIEASAVLAEVSGYPDPLVHRKAAWALGELQHEAAVPRPGNES